MGVPEGKKLGGRKEICPNFSDYARPVPKIFFPEQLNFEDLPPPPPPSPKKFRSVYHFRGPKIFRIYQNFSKHHTNFSHISKFPAKLTEFFPFFFIISQYCPTVLAHDFSSRISFGREFQSLAAESLNGSRHI